MTGFQRALAVLLWASALPGGPSAASQDTGPARQPSVLPLAIEHDVNVGGMVSDRFTWRDAADLPRVAVLAHNDGQVGPGGTRGGELREFRYETPGGTRIVRASGSYASGFGYVVSHPDGGAACLPGDSSSLGHFFTGAFTRVFEGRHHAILRFTQSYPRYCTAGAPPASPIQVPVTLDWVVSSGRNDPLLAITWDLAGSGVLVNQLNDDSRAPYGELLFDGAADEGSHSDIAGVAWGDRYKFTSTNDPLTLNSGWSWNTPNSVPYVELWTSSVDASMATVQTQTITQQDAGGYWGVNRWNSTSAAGSACPADDGIPHTMPCTFNWPYQTVNYSFYSPGLQVNSPTNNTRFAWGTNFGFLGQAQYYVHGSAYYGGPLPDTTAPGWPRKSYSTFVVLGRRSDGPAAAAVEQIETVQTTTLTAALGSVIASGPAGANNPDTQSYDPAGWNHVYAAWALQAAGSRLDANFDIGAGSLVNPLLIVSAWTAAGLPSAVRLDGVTLVQDVDYFPSVRPCEHELWITLNRTLAGAVNRLEIDGTPRVVKGDLSLDANVDLVFRHQGSNRNMLWAMNGVVRSGSSWITSDPSGPSWQVAGSDDFDADAQSDLAFWNSSSGAVEFWMMNGASRVGAAVPLTGAAPLPPPWKLAATGDFNADGQPDLLWRNTTTQKLTIWTMNGTVWMGGLTPTPDQAVNYNWEVVATLDYDADGNRDLLWYNFSSGKIVLWTMDASVVRIGGNFTSPANAGDNNWKVYAGGDYGVGLGGAACTNDIVWRNAASGKVVAWYMDTAGNRTFGTFATPDAPTTDPDGNPTPATSWVLVGPR